MNYKDLWTSHSHRINADDSEKYMDEEDFKIAILEWESAKTVSRVELPVMPNEVLAGGDKRWKPKEKEIFYYVNFYTGVTEQVYTNSKIHTPRNLYKIGNCYKTKEEAQMKWDQIKKILIQR